MQNSFLHQVWGICGGQSVEGYVYPIFTAAAGTGMERIEWVILRVRTMQMTTIFGWHLRSTVSVEDRILIFMTHNLIQL